MHQDHDSVMLRLEMHKLLNFKYFHDLIFFLKTKNENFREIWGCTLCTIGKFLISMNAPRWFHIFQIYGAKVI